MTQKHSFVTLSEEQTLAWYQHLVQALHGYTLALALKESIPERGLAAVLLEHSSKILTRLESAWP